MSEIVIHVISDSLGDTAEKVADAVVSQFPDQDLKVMRLSKARTLDEICDYVLAHQVNSQPLVVLHTLVDRDLRTSFKRWAVHNGIYDIDLIGPAMDALASLTGEKPVGKAGLVHDTDAEYFRRIAAMEYTVMHDDGRNPETLGDADIVLIGVSRTSKTPLSLLLGMRGYKVANVPLALGMEAPRELFDLDPRRVFGLVSTTEVLCEIRQRRLGTFATVAASYADPTEVQADLDSARALMRRIGCIVLRTDRRAIEETAQEILAHYDAGFGVE